MKYKGYASTLFWTLDVEELKRRGSNGDPTVLSISQVLNEYREKFVDVDCSSNLCGKSLTSLPSCVVQTYANNCDNSQLRSDWASLISSNCPSFPVECYANSVEQCKLTLSEESKNHVSQKRNGVTSIENGQHATHCDQQNILLVPSVLMSPCDQKETSGSNSRTNSQLVMSKQPHRTATKFSRSVQLVDKSTQTSSFLLYARRSSSRTCSPVPQKLKEAARRRQVVGVNGRNDGIFKLPITQESATKDRLEKEADKTKEIFMDLVNEMFPSVDSDHNENNFVKSVTSKTQQRCIVMVVTIVFLFFALVV